MPTKAEIDAMTPEQLRVFTGQATKQDIDRMSPDQLKAVTNVQAPSKPMELYGKVVETVMSPIVAVGREIDKYTGAPTRAAISTMTDPKKMTDIAAPLKAFAKQFGKDPETAPTGKEIAASLGASTEAGITLPIKGPSGQNLTVSPAGVAGLGIDIGADITNIVPIGLGAKVGAKGAKMAITEGGGAVAKAGAKGIDLLTGTEAASKIVGGTAQRGKAVKLALSDLFSPKRAVDYKEMADIAAKNGIDVNLLPESVEFGQGSVINRAARVRREGPLGEKSMNDFIAGLEQVKGATKRKIEQIGGGPAMSKVEAGQLLRDSYDKAVGDFFAQFDNTYKSVMDKYPDARLTPEAKAKVEKAANDIWQFAGRRMTLNLTDTQKAEARQLLQLVEAVQTNTDDLGNTIDLLQHLGDASFKSQNLALQSPADIARMRKMYGTLKEAVIDTIGAKNGLNEKDIADALVMTNNILTDFISEKNVLARVMGNQNLAPEKVFDALVTNSDTQKIGALKKILPQQDLQRLKAAYLESLIRPANLEGDFNFKPFLNNVMHRKDVVQAFLDPAEIKEMADLMTLGDRWGIAVMSTSGTGASNLFKDITEGIKQGLISDAFIENLKARARQTAPPGTTFNLPGGIRQPGIEIPGLGITAPIKGKMERRGKGAQVISVQDTEESKKRRETVRGK